MDEPTKYDPMPTLAKLAFGSEPLTDEEKREYAEWRARMLEQARFLGVG